MKIGVLALQGAVEPHLKKLKHLSVTPIEVRTEKGLNDLSGIILPGGESTTMLHLLKLNSLWEPLKNFIQTKPAWGICAGAILLADKVTNPIQDSLKGLAIAVERNAYGRQSESFVTQLSPCAQSAILNKVEAVFIRAPKFENISPSVKVFFEFDGKPVLVEEGLHLASAFHPELTNEFFVHEYFLKKCQNNAYV